jgi:hypothetical protein
VHVVGARLGDDLDEAGLAAPANSGAAPSATTTISFTASWLNVNAGRCPPRCSPKNGLLKSAPSTEMFVGRALLPVDADFVTSRPARS